MENLDIYSKENLEGLINEVLYYLYHKRSYVDKRLSNCVLLYAFNKRYSVDCENHTFTYTYKDVPILVEENMNVEDYHDYYNKKAVTMCIEGRLNEYLYFQDVPESEEVTEAIWDIFKKHGFYYEFGDCCTIYCEEFPKASNKDD